MFIENFYLKQLNRKSVIRVVVTGLRYNEDKEEGEKRGKVVQWIREEG